MQAMIPAMPAPTETAPQAPKTSARTNKADEGKKSFSKQLDRAENRRHETKQNRSENKTEQAERTQQGSDGADRSQKVKERQNRKAASDDQPQNGTEQRTDMAASQEVDNRQQSLEKILQTLTAAEKNTSLVPGADAKVLTPQQETLDDRQGKTQIVTNLLDKVTSGLQKADQIAQQPTTDGAGRQEQNLIVEEWQARFSYQNEQTTTGQDTRQVETSSRLNLVTDQASTKTTFAEPAQSQDTTNKELSNLQKGMQVQITPEVTEQAGTGKTASGPTLEGAHQPRDTTSNYIHSNLPGVMTKESNDKAGSFQQNGQALGQNTPESTAEGQNTPTLQGQQYTPLIFSLDQAGSSQGIMQSGQQAASAASLRLPSGTEVPHSQIVNQVTDHFSMNRNLESGSVILRLHPAELGELRMEIKVEQDNIKAHITTHNPQVQDILDRNIPRLRDVLEQQGMNLEHIQVSVAADNSGNGQLFQEQFEQQQFSRNFRQQSNPVSFTIQEDEAEMPIPSPGEQNLSVHA